ncbi:MAG: hypothetical protein JSW61_04550 [Candidatus Thorarchaeota archaeon]|nr:MAG: hypothetical protein JSW61_04550 [Candidatus Thorarchaeota archaeon]
MEVPITGICPEKHHELSFNPVNDQAPVLQNPDDTDNMYAQLRDYQITAYVSVPDGYQAIEYIELSLYDNNRITEYWKVKYDENLNTFSEVGSSGNIALQTGSCSATRSGNDIDATFVLRIDWYHLASADVDVYQYVYDYNATSDADWYEVNWDIETRLDYSVIPSVTSDDGGTVDRGDLDEVFHITGTTTYRGSTLNPPSNQIDAWVSAPQYGSVLGPWSDTIIPSGAFDITCYADDQVGLDWYTVKIVEEGAGFGGSDLYYTLSPSDSYIADRVQVQSYSQLNSSRIDINVPAKQLLIIYYDYDDSLVTTGTVTVNGVSATYWASYSGWIIVDTKATAQAFTYNSVTFSGGSHSLAGAVDQNGQSITQTWDSLSCNITIPDHRINVNQNASGITVFAYYESDWTQFSGTLTLNHTTFLYTTVGKRGYRVISVTDPVYYISVIGFDGANYVIWDSLNVTITGPTNQRISVNENASGIVVTARYNFDNTSFDGVFAWNDTTFQYDTVGRRAYDPGSPSGDSHGITAIASYTGDWYTFCIWDRIRILSTSANDNRIDIWSSATISVTAELEYDNTLLTSGDTLYMNNSAMTWQTDHFELVTGSYDIIGRLGYFVNSTGALDSTYGITVVNVNGQSTNIIWDRLVIDIQADDETPNNGVQVNFVLTVVYDYDNLPCTTYTIQFHRNVSDWQVFTDANKTLFNDTGSDVTYTYRANTTGAGVSESTYGLTMFVTNVEQVVWTQIPNQNPVNDVSPVLINPDDTTYLYAKYHYYFITTNVSDPDGYSDIDKVILLLFDNSRTTNYWTLIFDEDTNQFSIFNGSGSLTLATWSSYVKSVNSIDITWHVKISWSHPDIMDIDVKQFVNDTSSEFDSDFYESNWDIETRLDILSLTIDDDVGPTDRGDLNSIFYVTGTLVYFGSGDNFPSDNETDVWVSMTDYGNSVGPWTDPSFADGNFDITGYADDQVGENILTIIVVGEGDGFSGTDLLYTAYQDTYISDRIQVQGYWVEYSHLNINDQAWLSVQIYYEYDMSPVIDGIVMINSISASYSGSGGHWNFTDIETSVTANTFDSVACSGNTQGITQVDQNSQFVSVIWDRLVIDIQASSEAVANGQEVTFTLSVSFDYDNSPCTSYQIVIERNGSWWMSFTDSNKSLFTDRNDGRAYRYTTRQVTSEEVHGITEFTCNVETTVWSATGFTGDGADVTMTLVAAGGVGIVAVLVILSRVRLKGKPKVTPVAEIEPPSIGRVEVLRGAEIVGDEFEYKVKVKNDTKSVINNVIVTIVAYPEDCMELSGERLKKIARIEPGGFRSPQFNLTPTKDCVEGQILTTVSYIDHQNQTQVIPVEPYVIRSVCDLLTPLESSLTEFEFLLNEMAATKEKRELNQDPEVLFSKALTLLPARNFRIIDSSRTIDEGVFRGIVRGFAEGKYTKKKLALRLFITGTLGSTKSYLEIQGLGEDIAMLPTTIDEIAKGLDQSN